jgi:hypothetical protein
MWRDRPEAIGPRRRRRLVAPASRRKDPAIAGSFVVQRGGPESLRSVSAATDAGSISPIVDRWCTEPSSYPDQEERRASSEGKKRSPRPYDRWALRDSNPRPSPCKGAIHPYGQGFYLRRCLAGAARCLTAASPATRRVPDPHDLRSIVNSPNGRKRTCPLSCTAMLRWEGSGNERQQPVRLLQRAVRAAGLERNPLGCHRVRG